MQFHNIQQNEYSTIQIALQHMEDFWEASSLSLQIPAHANVRQNTVTAWVPSPYGTIKINFDAALISKEGKGVVAGLARDFSRKPLDWFCRK